MINKYETRTFVESLGYCDKTSLLFLPEVCTCPRKVFLYENTNIFEGARIIINPQGDEGRFIMKKNSGSAEGLTVITGNHQREKGISFKDSVRGHKGDIDKDVVVEEDVWIGANVSLLPGVTIGRGATIGAGTVCYKSVPPYAVVIGNPAKVVGFNYNPDEIIEHEKALYSQDERLSREVLNKNYEKYFLNRVQEIKQFTKL